MTILHTNKHGDPHCEDGPAVINDKGEYWYCNGVYHCTTGPAIRRKDGTAEWYISGLAILDGKTFQERTGMSAEDTAVMVLKYGSVQ